MPVQNTTKSLASPMQTLPQRLEQDVVLRSIVSECLSSETTVVVLLLMLEGFVKETLSPDTMSLAIGRAVHRLRELGLDNDESRAVVNKFANWSEVLRRSNPFSVMF